MTTSTVEPLALGIDIGGTTTKIGIISQSGTILVRTDTPTNVETVGLEPFLAQVFSAARQLLDQTDQEVVGIGCVFCGWIDEARTGPFLCFNAPHLHGVNLQARLEAEFRLPVRLTDDSTAHAWAEYRLGAGRGSRRFMNLALGTGLSASVILYGQALQFTGGCAGDTGHLILRPDGPQCSAGCRGCAEALIGVAGIERLAEERCGTFRTAHQVITLARAGDPTAVEVISEVGSYAGELLASLSHIFLPERISLSGGTATAGAVLLDSVRRRFEEINGGYHRLYSRYSNGYYKGVEIVLGELKGDTGLIGSVVNLFETRA